MPTMRHPNHGADKILRSPRAENPSTKASVPHHGAVEAPGTRQKSINYIKPKYRCPGSPSRSCRSIGNQPKINQTHADDFGTPIRDLINMPRSDRNLPKIRYTRLAAMHT